MSHKVIKKRLKNLKFQFGFSVINLALWNFVHGGVRVFPCIAVITFMIAGIVSAYVNGRHTSAILSLPVNFVVLSFELNADIFIFF